MNSRTPKLDQKHCRWRKFARRARSGADPRQRAATEVPAVSDSHRAPRPRRALSLAALVAVPLTALFATPPPEENGGGLLSAQRLAAVMEGGRLTLAINLPAAQKSPVGGILP